MKKIVFGIGLLMVSAILFAILGEVKETKKCFYFLDEERKKLIFDTVRQGLEYQDKNGLNEPLNVCDCEQY